MSEPKRHHQVPQAYLERFAEGGKVRVRRRDGGDFEASPLNVAVESGYYGLRPERMFGAHGPWFAIES